MWLNEWCKSIVTSPLIILFSLAVFVVHVIITVRVEQESQKGFLPRLVAYAYVATLFSLVLGAFCFSSRHPIFALSPWLDTVSGVLSNLFTYTLPIFIFALIAGRVTLRRDLARMNRFLILSYVFFALIVNGAQSPG